MIQQTSLQAYEALKDIGFRQMQVYKALQELGQANNLMIAKKLGLPINSVTPRVLELRSKGLIAQSMTYPCPFTKRLTFYWKLKDNTLASTGTHFSSGNVPIDSCVITHKNKDIFTTYISTGEKGGSK